MVCSPSCKGEKHRWDVGDKAVAGMHTVEFVNCFTKPDNWLQQLSLFTLVKLVTNQIQFKMADPSASLPFPETSARWKFVGPASLCDGCKVSG